MARKAIPRRPKAVSRSRDGRLQINLDAMAEGRIIDAGHDTEEARRLLADIARTLANGGELFPADRAWLAERLARISEGEDANLALGVRRKRGDRSLGPAEVRKRLHRMAIEVVFFGTSENEAAIRASDNAFRDESVLRKLHKQYPDAWSDEVISMRAERDAIERAVRDHREQAERAIQRIIDAYR